MSGTYSNSYTDSNFEITFQLLHEFHRFEIVSKCIDGVTRKEQPFCYNGTRGKYDPGPYAGSAFNPELIQQPSSNMPSEYSQVGNWEDYAETFLTIVVEAYMDSNDQDFRAVASEILQGRNLNLDRRRETMQAILSGKWK